MTSKRKSHRKSPARKAARKGAALASKSARITAMSPFLISNPHQMENLMSQGKNKFGKLAGDASAFGRDGFEALNKSLTIFAKGFEDLMKTSMSIAQNAAEKQTKLIKEGLSAKTINEWAEVQNKITQTNFDDCIAAATKLSELSTRVLTESAEPLNSQITKSMKKAGEAIAA